MEVPWVRKAWIELSYVGDIGSIMYYKFRALRALPSIVRALTG